jgi:polygalacturonase
VLDCGAKADGRTDDSAAFRTALAASLDVFVPNGTYVIRQTLILRDAQTLRGEGEWISELVFHPEAALPPTAVILRTFLHFQWRM